MATTEERLQILKMIEQGKITAAEGAELLRALEQSDKSQKNEPLKGNSPARWFRVRVTDAQTGRHKVNVNIPMGLVNVGIKMGARFVPNIEDHGIMDAIRSGRQGKIIDVSDEEGGERVEIFVE